MGKIEEIDIVGDRSARVRRIMGRTLRKALEDHGGDIAGFALVSWDMRGSVTSGYFTDVGPVSSSLMPSFVKDALDRHVTLVMVEETSSNKITGAS